MDSPHTDRDTFTMTYSAERRDEVEAIRRKYVPQETNAMERLRALDARVGKKATAVSIAVGVIGTLVMGTGMSMAMTELGERLLGEAGFLAGVACGVVGMVILSCAYPLYNRTLRAERKKAAPEILRLTDELTR